MAKPPPMLSTTIPTLEQMNEYRRPIKVAASGYFNPLHKGHVEYLEKAKELGDYLIVIVNSDHQRALKGSKEFMDENEPRLNMNRLVTTPSGDRLTINVGFGVEFFRPFF